MFNPLWERRALRSAAIVALCAAGAIHCIQHVHAQQVSLLYSTEITADQNGFTGYLYPSDLFGWSVADIGDLDGDNVSDLAVGSRYDTLASPSLWILFMRADGRVRRYESIGESVGGFLGEPTYGFTAGMAGIGDIDGDGRTELAVADSDDLLILFLNSDGTVRKQQRITAPGEGFGDSVTVLGDVNGDGAQDLAVGGAGFNNNRGGVWIIFLNNDGTVLDSQLISNGMGGFVGPSGLGADFGASVAPVGDLDGDGVTELAVGEPRNDDGGDWRGAVWILFLNFDGTVRTQRKISDYYGGFNGILTDRDRFGTALANLGDLDGDGRHELAVGAPGDDDMPPGGSGGGRGAIWLLSLHETGFVRSYSKISAARGGFHGNLNPGDGFGASIARVGDINRNDVGEIAVGATGRDGPHPHTDDRGAMWILFPSGEPACLGDLDGNHRINALDLVVLLSNWGTDSLGADLADPADVVNVHDLFVLLQAWGICP